ncbi:SbtA family thio(seleno)oxazole RiPP natural product precursor [uncultured Desulfobacter sp.]|nr:SbtA family thio(seleno)oxazole RiPP natural product precursor [uncultured Desulfobacter sp.]
MDSKDLKKLLAGLCIAGLLTGSTATLSGCTNGSG